MKKLITLLSAVCLAAVLATPITVGAIALTISDSYYLGSIVPGHPAGESHEEGYIDQLRGMAAPSGPTTVGGQTYVRSSNPFGVPDGANLPAADFELKYEEQSLQNPFTLPGSYVYLLAKYGAAGTTQHSYVWVIAGLSGEVSVPNDGLSHISLFNRVGVPDGGITLLLLGSALTGLAAFRRKLA